MSVFSVNPREGNPVTTETLDQVCQSLGIEIKEEEKDDYRRLLAVFHESAEELMAMPEIDPAVDMRRFPRTNMHFPTKQDNPYGAWAWKCSIKDPNIKNGVLTGKTFAIKDNIAVKDVPMLLGTDFIKDFTPVSKPKQPFQTIRLTEFKEN
jgi:amidase